MKGERGREMLDFNENRHLLNTTKTTIYHIHIIRQETKSHIMSMGDLFANLLTYTSVKNYSFLALRTDRQTDMAEI